MNDTHQHDLSKLTEPETCSHGEAERALDIRVHGFGHRALIVAFFVGFGGVRVVVGCEDLMLDQRSDVEIAE